MNPITLRTRECLAKLEFDRKMADLQLEQIIHDKPVLTGSCPPLDEYVLESWGNRVDALKVKIQGFDIEIKFLKTKISIDVY